MRNPLELVRIDAGRSDCPDRGEPVRLHFTVRDADSIEFSAQIQTYVWRVQEREVDAAEPVGLDIDPYGKIRP